MGILVRVFRVHRSIAQRHRVAAIIALAMAGVAIYAGIVAGEIVHAIGYLLAVWVCALLVDVVTIASPSSGEEGFPIRHPVERESLIILICTAIGIAFLVFRFSVDWGALPGLVKLATLPLMVFVYPIVLAIVYLVRFRYSLPSLGLSYHNLVRNVILAAIVMLVFGCVTLTVAEQHSHWGEMWREEGIIGLVLTGILGAGLSEEFIRALLQTRLGWLFKNVGLGFVCATFIWGCMHIPVFSRADQGGNLLDGTIGAIRIMPLGLLWGYMTHRTKSIIPSVLVHGLNLWGLQNF